MTKEQKLEKAAEVRAKINKDYGVGTVMNLSEVPESMESISTGSLGLDLILGVDGFPKGRIVEIYGPESSGKTTLAIHTIAEAQRKGGLCAIVDAEHAFSREYAADLGVNVDELDICQPSCGDEGLEVVDKLVNSGVYDVVVVDSVAALVPKAELEGEMGESKMGLHARLMSQACRKLTPAIAKTNTLVIFINQLREKIGVMFGDPNVTTGGNALKFYASVRLSVTRSTTEKNSVTEGDVKMGNQTTVKVIKNKVAPPFRSTEFYIMYGTGIDRIKEVITIGKDLGVLKLRAGIVTYLENKFPVEDFSALLKDNPEFYNEIYQAIKYKFNNPKEAEIAEIITND